MDNQRILISIDALKKLSVFFLPITFIVSILLIYNISLFVWAMINGFYYWELLNHIAFLGLFWTIFFVVRIFRNIINYFENEIDLLRNQ